MTIDDRWSQILHYPRREAVALALRFGNGVQRHRRASATIRLLPPSGALIREDQRKCSFLKS
jgi:hypothetical protein